MSSLYLKDCYLKEFESAVRSVKDGIYVILEETAFYPASGGQPSDTGTITAGDGTEYSVAHVGKFSGEISHEVDKPGLKEGERIKGSIDWERRHKLMRMHTAAHILSGCIHKKTNALITGNQLDTDKSRIDFDLGDFDRTVIGECMNGSNEIVKRALPIKIYFLEREEAMKIGNISKLAKGLPDDIGEVRIVEITGFDMQADGGTHVKNTSEVGELEFISAENKGKSNRRVYFSLK